jgi:hypothetical protein
MCGHGGWNTALPPNPSQTKNKNRRKEKNRPEPFAHVPSGFLFVQKRKSQHKKADFSKKIFFIEA